MRRPPEHRSSFRDVLSSPLVVAVVTAALTTLVNNTTTQQASSREEQQRIQDRKLELVGNVAADIAAYRPLRRAEIACAIMLAQQHEYDEDMTLAVRTQLETALQKAMPREYASSQKIDDRLAPLQRELMLAGFYFGPDTRRALSRVQELVGASPFRFAARFDKNDTSNEQLRTRGDFPVYVAYRADHEIEDATNALLGAMQREMVDRNYVSRRSF